jgi:putative colanic acid biosynthesis glycosyltransferase WcaI
VTIFLEVVAVLLPSLDACGALEVSGELLSSGMDFSMVARLMPLRLQLWSWNYEPEPTAMGPISTIWARTMRDRGHSVHVVTAHPHYPPGLWKQRVLPRRERRDGIMVTRLPLWLGHGTTVQRIREELTYSLSAALAMPAFRTPDAVVCVSPSFVALAPMLVNARLRRVPLVLWLQDILPDAAQTTGLLRAPVVLAAARALERSVYGGADRIVVASDSFKENLRRKGVPESKLERIYNPATRGLVQRGERHGPPRILAMGNIGYSQGLVELVREYEASTEKSLPRLVITGEGELAGQVRAELRSDRVQLLGLVDDSRLEAELDRATLGLVSQRSDIEEFNIPSKLMTLMGRGIPVLASVSPRSEVARIVEGSGGGWVADSSRPEEAARVAREAARNLEEVERRAKAAHAFAREHFAPEQLAGRFDEVLAEIIRGGSRQVKR